MNGGQVGIARGPWVLRRSVSLSAGLVLDDSLLGGDGAVSNILSCTRRLVALPVIVIYTSCDPTGPTELTFFLCRERDDVTALLASKGQQLWMRPNVGLPAVQFHGPLAQFAAGWCKACFRGSSHFLSLDLGSLITIMGGLASNQL